MSCNVLCPPATLVCALGMAAGLVLARFAFSGAGGSDIAIDWSSAPPVVAIRSVGAGRYLELFGADGAALAAGSSSPAPSARFRLLRVGAGTVKRLREQAAAHDTAMESLKMKTRSGCRCSGFSSEHGFGRYCNAWETAWEDPWCYVDETCASATVKKGSFGRDRKSVGEGERADSG